MLKNYLLVALRRFRREKGYTTINVLGLAVGIACCLLLGAYVLDEIRYDRFHPEADRTVRLVLTDEDETDATVGGHLGPALVRDYAGVEQMVRVFKHWERPMIARDEQAAIEDGFYFADSTFFEVFGFQLVRGDPETALSAPLSVVLTESMAQTYFGPADPMGHTLRYNTQYAFTVTGVLADGPAASHLQPDFIASLSSLPQVSYAGIIDEWAVFHTYLVLAEGTTEEAAIQATTEFLASRSEEGTPPVPSLQPMISIHLHSALPNELEANGDIRYVYLLATLGLLILLIACINYMNLATARSLTRAREVGVRKAAGARSGQIAGQFFSESILMALLALGLALGLLRLFTPALEALTGKALHLDASVGLLIFGSIGLVVVIGLIVGSYPALVLSRYRPAAVLKGAIKMGSRGHGLRKHLVVVQFVASMVLLVGTAVVFQQLQYVQDARLGFDREQVVAISVQDGAVRGRYTTLREQWLQDASVRAVGATSSAYPGRTHSGGHLLQRPETAAGEALAIQRNWVDGAYLETLGVDLVAGRGFTSDLVVDSQSVVLNESAVRALGWTVPQEVIGEALLLNGEPGTVVGVTADFHFASLHEQIAPLVLTPSLWPTNVLVRLDAAEVAPALARLGTVWNSFSDQPFSYRFLDDELDALYRADAQWARVLGASSLLAIFVACLGLFGLAAFTTEQRTKEIGVRKVLGASVADLVGLLSRDFLVLVGIAFLIATPLAFLAMTRWLSSFAYRVDLGPLPFIVAGALAAGIALLTVSVHALRAATSDPIQALRYE